MAGVAILKTGKGFGTWLIPIIIFGALGSIAVLSLVALLCVYSHRPRRRTTDQEPEMTYETYRTPTIPYRDPSSERPVDSTIGRLIRHSRSLHVPRNQLINGPRLRAQVSSPELRNTSRPPPYMFRAMTPSSPYRNPRPHGQVYFDQILDPGHPYHIPQQPRQFTPPPGNTLARPGRRSSVSSPSSYSSTCLSSEGHVSAEAFSHPSTPSIFSQESFIPARAASWVDFPEPGHSGSDFDGPGPLLTPSSLDDLSAVSAVPASDDTEKFPTARPRRRSETGGRTGRSGQNNRRLIIVDNNLLSRDPDASSDGAEIHDAKRLGISRLIRGTLESRVCAGATNNTPHGGETSKPKEVKDEEPPPAGHKKERSAVFKVICPDTSDLWKLAVIPGETLDGFAGRVKQKTGGDVILFMDDEVLASEEDWQVAKGGGRIVAHLIR